MEMWLLRLVQEMQVLDLLRGVVGEAAVEDVDAEPLTNLPANADQRDKLEIKIVYHLFLLTNFIHSHAFIH